MHNTGTVLTTVSGTYRQLYVLHGILTKLSIETSYLIWYSLLFFCNANDLLNVLTF